jgi:hypothetical protein
MLILIWTIRASKTRCLARERRGGAGIPQYCEPIRRERDGSAQCRRRAPNQIEKAFIGSDRALPVADPLIQSAALQKGGRVHRPSQIHLRHREVRRVDRLQDGKRPPGLSEGGEDRRFAERIIDLV